MISSSPVDLLKEWVLSRSTLESGKWFDEQLDLLRNHPSDKQVYLALGYAPRKVGKTDLNLREDELIGARKVRNDWDPRAWSIDQAARTAFVLTTYGLELDKFRENIERLFITADVGELIALYQALPLYPYPTALLSRAREGTRSAMQPVFEAVAHRNPYPREVFDESAWNHMVLKALFIGSKLAPIQGLDERTNPQLARMLSDYAHERWAAGRPVPPELWRCVGPFADERAVADLATVLEQGDPIARRSAVLALASCHSPEAQLALRGAPDLAAEARAGHLTWEDVR